MANGVQRKRKAAQKGVQAVFTPTSERKLKVESIFGLAALSSGAVLWIWSMQSIGVLNADAIVRGITSSPLLAVSLAMLLSMGGVGLGTYGLAVRKMKKANEGMASAINKLEALLESQDIEPSLTPEPGDEAKLPEGQVSLPRISKTTALALAEGVMLIIVYGVLVLEYKSNIHMQEWVRANLVVGQYLLNEVALILVAATLAGVFLLKWWRQRDTLVTTRLK